MRAKNTEPSSGTWSSPVNPLTRIKDLRIESIEELRKEYDIVDLSDLKDAVENGFDLQEIHGIGPATEETIIQYLVSTKDLDFKYLREVKK